MIYMWFLIINFSTILWFNSDTPWYTIMFGLIRITKNSLFLILSIKKRNDTFRYQWQHLIDYLFTILTFETENMHMTYS